MKQKIPLAVKYKYGDIWSGIEKKREGKGTKKCIFKKKKISTFFHPHTFIEIFQCAASTHFWKYSCHSNHST